MKAIVCPRYGPPDVLQLREVDTPKPKDDDVLIKIHAAGLFAGDTELRAFRIPISFWIPIRLLIGVRRPRRPILGQEVAGEVVAVGKNVRNFRQGDAVFAGTGGAGGYAQYICLPETGAVAAMPGNLSYEEAAAVPVGGTNALHFLRRVGIRPGEKVAIYGACGGIGTHAVQIAKAFGGEVTAIDSADKLDTLRAIGADHVLDYQRTDFPVRTDSYDVIFDVVGKSRFGRCIRSLKPNGRYALANPSASSMIRGLWTSLTGSRKVVFAFADERAEHLNFLRDMIEAGQLRPVIDRSFPLEQAAQAHWYVESGQKKGSVVLTVDHAHEN